MKKTLEIILSLLVYSSLSYGQNSINITPEQRTQEEYEAGQRVIREIILENNLHDELDNCAYAGFFTEGGAWIVVVKGISSYNVYSGNRNITTPKQTNYALSDKVLNSLFAWIDYPTPVVYDKRDSDSEYHPLYHYFVLFDGNHDKKIEFNSYTMSAFKSIQKPKKYRKQLPFTNEQFKFIVDILSDL